MRSAGFICFLLLACSGTAPTTSPTLPTSTTAAPATTLAPSTTTAPTTTSRTAVSTSTEVEIELEDGQVSPPPSRVKVPLGNTVLLRVKSDLADEVHIHGYDLVQEVVAGGSASFEFVADVPGIFEVELEAARLLLVELEVGP